MSDAKSPRLQCSLCPWKKTTDPRDIPNGYDEDDHRSLTRTIADESHGFGGALRVMACHETKKGKELPCVGWLHNQLGPGNNIGLRLRARSGAIDTNVETVGEQHRCLEDTFPKPAKRKKVRRG